MNARKRITGRPIICGTDFSATAVEATDIAAAIASRLKTRLVLVHVDQFYRSLVSDPILLEEATSERRRHLHDEAQRLRDLGTEVEQKFVGGSAFDKLVTTAEECKARLTIVGAIGHGLASRLLLGSVAERTAETSPIPTLVVRPGGRLASWINGRHTLQILVGYDFSAASDAALAWVNQVRELGKCEVTVLYSSWPPDETRRLGYERPLPLTANPKDIQRNIERDLKKHVATLLKQEATIVVQPGWGSPEGYLFEMASRKHVDLTVVGTHQRRGLGRVLLGSVSRAVLHHAKMAVAIVPPAKVVRQKQRT